MARMHESPVQRPVSMNDRRLIWGASLLAAAMWWLAGPPLNAWWLSMLIIAPWVWIATGDAARWKLPVYVGALLFFLVSLQGLRHAHTWMFLPWIAMAAYLAIYPVLFVGLIRSWKSTRFVPIALAAGVFWVGLEWIRNYLLTGISVLMLGHTVANVPWLIQIADLLGTYGVSFVLSATGATIAELIRHRGNLRHVGPSIAVALGLLIATIGYGVATSGRELQNSGATIMLVGRHERTEYIQDHRRESEIFRTYARQTIQGIEKRQESVDAIVWPESMFNAGGAWLSATDKLTVPTAPPGADDWPELSVDEFRASIEGSQRFFQQTAAQLQREIANAGSLASPPPIIGGCALVRYGEQTEVFSGVVMVGSDGRVASTYAKNHLVLFGETIPIVESIPWVRDWMPPGMGLARGREPVAFGLQRMTLLPNLCIETAVERIAVNHLHALHQSSPDGSIPDAIVTLTNDAWFNQSAVVEHHLRCAQLVAVATRRPILSAANGGPTAWIDSDGQIVERLSPGVDGNLFAQPKLDSRISFYVRYGSIFAAALACLTVVAAIFGLRRTRAREINNNQSEPEA